MSNFQLKSEQKEWCNRRTRQKISCKKQEELLKKQKGKCNLSGCEMIFDSASGTPKKGKNGCHPLYPAVDHIDPGNPKGDFQIVCYALNDVKGHLPYSCFKALKRTKAWKEFMKAWRYQAKNNSNDRESFRVLIRPNAISKK